MQFIDEEVFLLGESDYRVMPWKNGGGSTREIFAHPVDTQDFDWRLSIADVNEDGAFSAFDGYARTILLLEGNGMELAINDEPAIAVSEKFAPLDFDGGAQTRCTLLDGPVRDFNIMTHRARASHECRVIDRFPHAMPRSTTAAALAVFVLRGTVNAHVTRSASLALPTYSTLLLAAPRRLQRLGADASADAAVLLVQFRRRAG